ncbi:hypothetical protein RIF29_25552 [Crotalaria pallida]|uniref:Uncharacterized protein n=1 Tax=Crotalaria pallida TaxID=3830 RepID=A0AAN9HXK9_CROPI
MYVRQADLIMKARKEIGMTINNHNSSLKCNLLAMESRERAAKESGHKQKGPGFAGVSLKKKFTWYQRLGNTMSRLKRILLFKDWINLWGASCHWALLRDVSDHTLLVMKSVNNNLGPKPFRFNNFWFKELGFSDLMQTSEINPLEEKAATVSLSDDELRLRKANMAEHWRTLNNKATLVRQKFRARWIKEEGDVNCSYFHACLAQRQKRNNIFAILVDD